MADGSDPEFQAKKLDEVAGELRSLRELMLEEPKQPKKPDAKPNTHGSGTGDPQGPKD